MTSLDQFRTIRIDLDNANDYTPPIRLNAGDIDGRELTVVITDNGTPLTDADNLTAQFAWNNDIDDPNSAGGYTTMTRSTVDGTTAFTATIPRSLLASASGTSTLGVIIKDGDHTLATRNFTAIVEPSVLNADAPDIEDPLKELHEAAESAAQAKKDAQEAVEQAQRVIDTANLEAGTVTALNPNANPTFSLDGEGLNRTMNLGIPRGAGISEITVETLTPNKSASATTGTDSNGDKTLKLGIPRGAKISDVTADTLNPGGEVTVSTGTDGNGDTTITLGIPRGEKIRSVDVTTLDAGQEATVDLELDANRDMQITLGIPRGDKGDKGDKGEKGDAGTIATATTPGIVKASDTITVDADGTMHAKVGSGVIALTGTNFIKEDGSLVPLTPVASTVMPDEDHWMHGTQVPLGIYFIRPDDGNYTGAYLIFNVAEAMNMPSNMSLTIVNTANPLGRISTTVTTSSYDGKALTLGFGKALSSTDIGSGLIGIYAFTY